MLLAWLLLRKNTLITLPKKLISPNVPHCSSNLPHCSSPPPKQPEAISPPSLSSPPPK
ncbi:hypothetical protein NC652_002888 [Populus alba x Populus x berolinensis]|uniref:Uncharacterized protein n=1 Tax=Populus alba x Populus x berolinensis TaxID=444605 RepID=A0AAD6LDY1_9ROSI|nr:hypothetical protein NC653_037224 [Populus alba x Populus x berolinensis]KAJ6964793.1 hypothetical protein NC652_002888 [Populus alba x Populus x berolinensis]